MMYITLGLLEELDACGPAREWFDMTYPNGVELGRESLDSCPEPGWVWWLGCALDKSGMLVWNAPNIAFREAAKVGTELQEWVGKVGPSNWREAWAAAEDAARAARAARAAEDAAWAARAARAAAEDASWAARAAWAAAEAAEDAAEDASARVWAELREIATQSLLGGAA